MCVNYLPPNHQQLAAQFGAPLPESAQWRTETWQDYVAPIIVGEDNTRQALLGAYSMIPKSHIAPGLKRYSTMNARAETIATLRSFAQPWRDGQLCLVPMTAYFEPNYESGKAERWQIGLASAAPFAVAGLYRTWVEGDGSTSFSFTQVTINADQHPLMKRFHKPEDEKRALVILPAESYDDWLHCRDPMQAASFLTNFPAELMAAQPAPKKTAPTQAATNGELF